MGIETTSESRKIWQRGWSGFCGEGRAFESRRRLQLLYFTKDENPTFQIRSGWAQFSRFERFQRFYFLNNCKGGGSAGVSRVVFPGFAISRPF
jgi:hypothetical protein